MILRAVGKVHEQKNKSENLAAAKFSLCCRDLQRQEHSRVPELELCCGTSAIFMEVFQPHPTLMRP